MTLTPEVRAKPGRRDPVLGALSERFTTIGAHRDAIAALPPGALALARNDRYLQAFRVGACAWGVQFHPEATMPIFSSWARQAKTEHGADEVLSAERQVEESWSSIEQTGLVLAGAFGRLVEACRVPTA